MQVPQCLINFNLAPSGSVMHPTCHAHSPARDGFDLLVGLSTGDGVHLCSLQGSRQLGSTSTNSAIYVRIGPLASLKTSQMIHFGVAVVVASLQAQVAAPQTNTKLVSQLHFNSESSVDATRAVGVEWVPHTNGDLFVAAHMSGSVYTYSKVTHTGRACNLCACYSSTNIKQACAQLTSTECMAGECERHWRPLQC